ncbi:MAG TPA: hypothetical protein VNC85_11715 [Mycobacteriales bacterium]|nr:hypothetical protein [Mycobacteriales bacterium]
MTGVVWASEIGTTVGRGGFHGPPDGSGMVEVGYARSIPRTGRRGTRGPRLSTTFIRSNASTIAATISSSVTVTTSSTSCWMIGKFSSPAR